MGKYVAEQTVKQMIHNGSPIKNGVVNVLGLTFKENCSDLRNSRVYDVIQEFRSYGVRVFIHDPVASPEEAKAEYGVDLVDWQDLPVVGATVLAVAHQALVERPVSDFAAKTVKGECIADIKSKLDEKVVQEAGLKIWRL